MVQLFQFGSSGMARGSFCFSFFLRNLLFLALFVFMVFFVRMEANPKEEKKRKRKLSLDLHISLPDALLMFEFDSSRKAEVRWFLEVICLLPRTRHCFMHKYLQWARNVQCIGE